MLFHLGSGVRTSFCQIFWQVSGTGLGQMISPSSEGPSVRALPEPEGVFTTMDASL